MIKKFEMTGVHADMDEKLKKYVTKKVTNLDRYIPRHARASAHADVKLIEQKSQSDKKCTAEVILYLPHDKLIARESTLNMFAAVDIVEAKLKNQLKKYKDAHTADRFHRRVIQRFRRSG